MTGRSFEQITLDDLSRLGNLAKLDRKHFFLRNPQTAQLYSDRLFSVALCQGAATHYIDGQNGIKDFDVWGFYRAHPIRPFPPRRRAKVDFGDPKFGQTEDSLSFVGRRVDLIGRSIDAADFNDPLAVLENYLRSAKTLSASLLAQKAMVLIEPKELRGTIVWPRQRENK